MVRKLHAFDGSWGFFPSGKCHDDHWLGRPSGVVWPGPHPSFSGRPLASFTVATNSTIDSSGAITISANDAIGPMIFSAPAQPQVIYVERTKIAPLPWTATEATL
jgi:hypothetical protein